METLELLKQAISTKTPISFYYNKEGKVRGERIGNPHAIFHNSNGDLQVDIAQTGGISSSTSKNPFPNFRTFDFQNIVNVTVLDNEQQFNLDHNYNSNSEKYGKAIALV